MTGTTPPTKEPDMSRLRPASSKKHLLLPMVVIIAICLAAFGIMKRREHYAVLSKQADESALPWVTVISPEHGPTRRTLDLPANISAWYLAPIYAQVSGYVKMWYKDIGAKVKAGDLLAEIDTPSLDAQYEAAKASLTVTAAHYKLAQITAKRWKALQGTQAVSQQEVDVQAANAEAQKAEVDAARYNVEKYAAQEAFKRIVAPFDGVVTARMADVGDYVNAGRGDVSSNGSVSELFSVADVHAMRVFVSVPQDYADIISPKLTATLSVPQFPGRTFKATYLTTASAFSSSTRTVTTEFIVDNRFGELWPNSYATIHFEAPDDSGVLILPLSALIFRAEGTQIATVDADNRVHLKNVTIGRNLGRTIQILSGLNPDDKIVANPPAGLVDQQKIRITVPTPHYNDNKTLGLSSTTSSERSQDDIRAMPDDKTPDNGSGAHQ